MGRVTLAVATALLLLPAGAAVLPARAFAATCGTQPGGPYPTDPGYAPAETAGGQAAGETWDGEDWYLFDCVPQTAPTATDPEGASGMSVAALWNRTTGAYPYPDRGRDDVLVAYMEGGVNWRIAQSCELKDRAWLNTANLPYPEDSSGQDHGTYDLNGDGVVNVEDYLNDPRVTAAVAALGPGAKTPAGGPFLHHVCSGRGVPNGSGYAPTDITPEDLIVAFGHCEIVNHEIGPSGCPATGRFDNAHDGYPNNINGWNFNRDDNDPQTEQSVYEHFDGESSTLVGEGDNGFSDLGLCPLCRYIPIKAGDEAIDRPDRVAEAIVFAADHGVDVMDVTDASLGLDQTVQDAIDYAWSRGTVVVWASNDFESADHTDGMFYAHVWPGNSITGDHSTRNGSTCPPAQNSSDAFCAWVKSDNTFLSRSSLTSYGPHALFSAPNTDGSTSTGTPTNAGVAALVVSEGRYATDRGEIASPLNADEVKQVVRATALPISQPCPAAEPCFSGPAGASFNIMYGYGRPNLLRAADLIDSGDVPPTASIDSPGWYQEFDPTTASSVHVTADVAARRDGAYTWRLQYGLGPQPLDTAWTTFASGSGGSAQTVSGDLPLTAIPQSFWDASGYSIDSSGRTSTERFDVSIRVQVGATNPANGHALMGEDRRAVHVDHDPTRRPGFPLSLRSSGDASPTLADIEGRGWLDAIVPTSDGSVYAVRPDGSEAPGFPVHTNPTVGMDPAYANNYLGDPAWGSNLVPRPRDPIFSTAAVGDLTHTGALDVVVGTSDGWSYAWDGAGRLLPGFPVLNGRPGFYGMSVPPPNTPFSFEPENITGGSPVLAHLVRNSAELDIVQVAGDNEIHAWRPDGSAVPGWPVSDLLPPGTVPSGQQQTHDSKIVPTPAVADVNGDGIPDVVVGLDDSILGTGPGGAGVVTFLEAFDGRGTAAGGPVSGNPALLAGYPVKIQGLVQGYGVAQDFVTQGVESPAVYDTGNGPQAVVNANLFLPFRVDLRTATPASNPFTPTTISPAPASTSCPTPNTLPPSNPGQCTLVQFTTSASLGTVLPGSSTPQVFQMGSAGVDVLLGITQTEGIGVRVDNGVGGWDPASGASLSQYSHYVQGLAFFAAPTIADVTGPDSGGATTTPDIIVPADSGAIMAFDGATGATAAGFPKWTGGWSVFSPATGDLAGDGRTDLVAMTREGYLFEWQTGGDGCSGNSESWHWHQDDWNDGHYGSDTRPPSAITDLSVSAQGASDVLAFTATGDNWRCGTAAKYDLFTSASPITQQTLSSATRVPLTQSQATPTGPAGTPQSLTIPASVNQGFLAVRAEDAAGNLGPILVAAGPSSALPEFAAGPVAALLAASGIAVAAFMVPRRRRRHARRRS
jgi:hypothetical protein